MQGRTHTILLLESDESDVFFFRRALGALHFDGQVRVVASLGEARDYMEGRGKFADRDYFPLPHIVFAELKVAPQKAGDAVIFLKELIGTVPLVVYSDLATPENRAAVLGNGADAFFPKPDDFDHMLNGLRQALARFNR